MQKMPTFQAVARLAMLAGVLAVARPAAGDGPRWKAGVASVKITPDGPVMLLGYDREGPSTGVDDELYAQALALEDADGGRAVVVAADLVGFQAAVVTDEVARRIAERTGLPRQRLILNASHTHTGPLVSLEPNLTPNVGHGAMTPEQAEATVAYTRRLRDQLVELVERALADLRPAELSWGTGQANVAVSRRLPTPAGVVVAPNPDALVDRSVPVLRVDGPDGARARSSSAAPATPSPPASRTPSAPTTPATRGSPSSGATRRPGPLPGRLRRRRQPRAARLGGAGEGARQGAGPGGLPAAGRR